LFKNIRKAFRTPPHESLIALLQVKIQQKKLMREDLRGGRPGRNPLFSSPSWIPGQARNDESGSDAKISIDVIKASVLFPGMREIFDSPPANHFAPVVRSALMMNGGSVMETGFYVHEAWTPGYGDRGVKRSGRSSRREGQSSYHPTRFA
jgi:hypothetical protein